MLDSKNKLAILACHAKNTEFLFCYKDENLENIRQQDGQYELFTQVERCIRTNLQKLIKKENALIKDISHSDSLIAGAIAMALCYIHR